MMSRVKILTVSRDPVLVKLMQQLNGDEYQVTSTRQTGEELKDQLTRETPDIVILDIMMPNLEGIEVCLRIRQWSLMPILMLSTWGVEPGKVRRLNLSNESYLTEPFDLDEVKTRIQETLQRSVAAMKNVPAVYPRVPVEK
ncbi:MAG: response regulator [Dehalococcoidales bacterium]|nr:response regulator [Dehalococcoidales bacterium]